MKRSKNSLSSNKKAYKILVIIILIVILSVLIFRKDRSADTKVSIPTSPVKVKLLNGCGFPGVARDVKDYFDNSEHNVTVVSIGNVSGSRFIYRQSIIVAKQDDEEKLSYLQQITGIERRIYAYDDNLFEEFHIILGNDYKKYFEE